MQQIPFLRWVFIFREMECELQLAQNTRGVLKYQVHVEVTTPRFFYSGDQLLVDLDHIINRSI